MPNWCVNRVTLKHSDPEQLERVAFSFSQHRLLSEFCPGPTELRDADEKRNAFANAEVKSENLAKYGVEHWIDWAIANWGTKWDVGSDEHAFEQDDFDFSSGQISLQFESAWEPPIAGFRHMEQQGFEVELFYYEPGMAFCGKYTTANGDARFEYGQLSAQKTKDTLPAELDELFDITTGLFAYEEFEKNATNGNN